MHLKVEMVSEVGSVAKNGTGRPECGTGPWRSEWSIQYDELQKEGIGL
jgi:hypothetical protein